MEINYEIIEKYLAEELSLEEINDFNKELETNEEFKKEFELYKEINTSLTNKYSNLQKENKLKNTLETLGNKHFKKEEVIKAIEQKSNSVKKYLFSISSIAAIFALAFFLLKPQANLYDQFAEHSLLEIQVKGNSEENLLQAAEYFNNAEYNLAIPLLEDYLKENPKDLEIKITLGISLLEKNKIDEAIAIFTEVYNKNNIFKNKAKWYLALAHLKNTENSKAKNYLSKITKNSFYYSKANKLLDKLD